MPDNADNWTCRRCQHHNYHTAYSVPFTCTKCNRKQLCLHFSGRGWCKFGKDCLHAHEKGPHTLHENPSQKRAHGKMKLKDSLFYCNYQQMFKRVAILWWSADLIDLVINNLLFAIENQNKPGALQGNRLDMSKKQCAEFLHKPDTKGIAFFIGNADTGDLFGLFAGKNFISVTRTNDAAKLKCDILRGKDHCFGVMFLTNNRGKIFLKCDKAFLQQCEPKVNEVTFLNPTDAEYMLSIFAAENNNKPISSLRHVKCQADFDKKPVSTFPFPAPDQQRVIPKTPEAQPVEEKLLGRWSSGKLIQPSTKSSTKTTSATVLAAWKCGVCTLENPGLYTTCDACTTPRILGEENKHHDGSRGENDASFLRKQPSWEKNSRKSYEEQQQRQQQSLSVQEMATYAAKPTASHAPPQAAQQLQVQPQSSKLTLPPHQMQKPRYICPLCQAREADVYSLTCAPQAHWFCSTCARATNVCPYCSSVMENDQLRRQCIPTWTCSDCATVNSADQGVCCNEECGLPGKHTAFCCELQYGPATVECFMCEQELNSTSKHLTAPSHPQIIPSSPPNPNLKLAQTSPVPELAPVSLPLRAPMDVSMDYMQFDAPSDVATTASQLENNAEELEAKALAEMNDKVIYDMGNLLGENLRSLASGESGYELGRDNELAEQEREVEALKQQLDKKQAAINSRRTALLLGQH